MINTLVGISSPTPLFTPDGLDFFSKDNVTKTLERVFQSALSLGEIVKRGFMLKKVDPLAKLQKNLEKGGDFNFKTAMDIVKNNAHPEDQDKELAKLFYPFVNPKKIPDGHCAKCAFNTLLHLNGEKLEEAEAGNSSKFVKFSYWFYANFSPEVAQPVKTVIHKPGNSLEQFRSQVEHEIKKATKPDESVLISVGEGAHWYSAYNDGDRVWFIDAQTGKGFNTYASELNQENEESIELVKVSTEKISEYGDLCA